MFSQRIGLKFSRLTDQLITMEGINFKRDLIENFVEVSKTFEKFPQETLADIDNLVENIKKWTLKRGKLFMNLLNASSIYAMA